MSVAFISGFAFKAIRTVFLAALPLLLAGLITGVMISIFQAVTSISDQSLVFIPKVIAVMLSLLIFLPWILGILTGFTVELFTNFPIYIQ
ncbi:flagellar biosynthetic protein FliQ [bacterium]|nr:flagellar biosynthetic protein FliQ [bacterium]